MNLQKNKKYLLNLNKDIESWEEIPKVKWKGLPKEPQISKTIQKIGKSYTKYKAIDLLKRIKQRGVLHYTNKEINPMHPPIKHYGNLLNIVADKDILRISSKQLQKNKGAMTPGNLDSTADNVSEDLYEELSIQIKNGTFRWEPVRRIMIPKPGKKVKRPLGLPNFRDKIVQKAISLVLEAIYEPEFEYLDCNAGFRERKDPTHSIENIKRNVQGVDYAIEGDIEGAYNNVNQKALMTILRYRINCKGFLKLIERGLKAGIMYQGQFIDTFLGIPQGGIASPILFNIYMHYFDMYICYTLHPYVHQINEYRRQLQFQETKSTSQVNPEYEKLRSKQRVLERKIKDNINQMDIMRKKGKTISFEILIEITEQLQLVEEIFHKKDISKARYEEYKNTVITENEMKVYREYNRLRNKENNPGNKVTYSSFPIEKQRIIAKATRMTYLKKELKKMYERLL